MCLKIISWATADPPPPVEYFGGSFQDHFWGIVGGMIWAVGMTFSIIAMGVAGPAISYGLGQGATMVAAAWGVFVWREFREARPGTGYLLGGDVPRLPSGFGTACGCHGLMATGAEACPFAHVGARGPYVTRPGGAASIPRRGIEISSAFCMGLRGLGMATGLRVRPPVLGHELP